MVGQGDAAAAAAEAQAAAVGLAAHVASARAARWSSQSNFGLWLHADDVHSVEEVTRELMRVGFRRTSAAALAVAAATPSRLGVALIKVMHFRLRSSCLLCMSGSALPNSSHPFTSLTSPC
jgi:carbamoylphosphate synthase small subunit